MTGFIIGFKLEIPKKGFFTEALRGEKGRFTPEFAAEYNSWVRQAYPAQLQRMRNDLERIIDSSYVRPDESTGKLKRAHLDPQNSVANPFRKGGALIAIGRPEWLDSQQSQVNMYWRKIEFGTTEFVGRQVVLLKIRGSRSLGDRGRGPKDPGIRMFTGRFQSSSRSNRDPAIIRKPIYAHNYYDKLKQAQDPAIRRMIREQARRNFNAQLGIKSGS